MFCRHHALHQVLAKALDTALDQLEELWEEIGIISEQQTVRVEVAMQHLQGLLSSMVVEEENLKDKLLGNVEKSSAELVKLCQELHLPLHEVRLIVLEESNRCTECFWLEF